MENPELFDHLEHPDETRDLWADAQAQGLRCRMLQEFMRATVREEPVRMPRIAGA